MPNPKKPFIDDVTVVSGNMLSSIYGGIDGYQSDPSSPFFAGHIHSGRNDQWGFAPKINLTDHITGRLTLPTPELKSIKLSAAQATPLTSSLFWTLPIPADAYTTSAEPMFLNIYWAANGNISPGSVGWRVDWIYVQAGQNVIPPSVIDRGSSAWPANTIGSANPLPTTMRFKTSAAASQLYVNDTSTRDKMIQLTLPTNVPGAALNQFLLLGLEITSAPTTTLNFPMEQVNIFAVELLYYSSTMGVNNQAPLLLSNDPGLAG
jgi:hypothetical protein